MEKTFLIGRRSNLCFLYVFTSKNFKYFILFQPQRFSEQLNPLPTVRTKNNVYQIKSNIIFQYIIFWNKPKKIITSQFRMQIRSINFCTYVRVRLHVRLSKCLVWVSILKFTYFRFLWSQLFRTCLCWGWPRIKENRLTPLPRSSKHSGALKC